MSKAGQQRLNEYFVSLNDIEKKRARIHRYFNKWKLVVIVAFAALMLRFAAGQLAMAVIRQASEIERAR